MPNTQDIGWGDVTDPNTWIDPNTLTDYQTGDYIDLNGNLQNSNSDGYDNGLGDLTPTASETASLETQATTATANGNGNLAKWITFAVKNFGVVASGLVALKLANNGIDARNKLNNGLSNSDWSQVANLLSQKQATTATDTAVTDTAVRSASTTPNTIFGINTSTLLLILGAVLIYFVLKPQTATSKKRR